MTQENKNIISKQLINQSEEVKLLYDRAHIGFIASIVNAIVILFVLRHEIQHKILFIWFMTLVIIIVSRFILVLVYHKKNPQPEETKKWSALYLIGVFIHSVLWGVAGILLFPKSLPHILFLTFSLSIFTIIAIILTFRLQYIFIYLTFTLLPITVQLFILGSELLLVIAFLIILLAGLTVVITRRIYGIILNSMELHLVKENLIKDLTEAKKSTDDMNIFLQKEIEERKQIESQLSEMNKKLLISENSLRELNANKDKFFSIISHDLKSPFNALIGFTEMCLNRFEKMDSVKLKEYLEKIHRAASNLYSLVDNLLQWSRFQSGKMEYNPISFQIIQSVTEVINLFSVSSSKKNITIQNEVSDQLYVYADYHMINSVLRNLVSNAIKFTEHGGSIKITAIQNNDKINISIIDSGVGISNEDKDKLFRMDIRHSTYGTDNEKGTGLGLLLCKDLLEKNNGTLWFEGTSDKGTSFHFTLNHQNT